MLCFSVINLSYAVSSATRIQGPLFIHEPPLKVEFMNDKGATVDCLAHGEPEPQIEWITDNGVKVHDSGWIRRVYNNGSMVLAPFSADQYRQEVHASVYKCTASNIHGRIVSSPVSIRAAIRQQQQQLQAQVYDVYVMRDNTAVLTCHIPTFLKDDLEVTSWVREDNFVIRKQPTRDPKYALAEDGKLYVSGVTSQDGGMNYWCRVHHKLSNETILSSTAGNIVITEPHRNLPLKITNIMSRMEVKAGTEFIVLPCAAQGYPPPTYRWLMKDQHGNEFAITAARQRHGNLIVKNIKDIGTKQYTCVAENNNHSVRKETSLLVTDKIRVHVEPQYLVVDSGQKVQLNCSTKGFPINSEVWKLNGKPVEFNSRVKSNSNILTVENIGPADEGMYQCFVSNDYDAAQGTAQIRLGAIPPRLIKTFSSRVLQPGPSIEIECSATGNPKPIVTWSTVGSTIEASSKYQIKEFYKDKVATTKLTIRNIRSRDGGDYTCTAQNKLGVTSHTDSINVYGLPLVHPIENATVGAGQNVVIKCYVSGYPIKFIKWRRSSPKRRLPKSSQTTKNGTLTLKNVRNDDGGIYKCTANNGRGQKASKLITVRITKKPEIGTLSSPGKVEVGKLVTIVCTVKDGDEPIRISWLKDGLPLSVDLGIDFMEAKRFSYLQIREIKKDHSGNYSCTAKNMAGESSKTVNLDILIPPSWINTPGNVTATIGRRLLTLKCDANGWPRPAIKWIRTEGEVEIRNSDKYRLHPNGTLFINNIEKIDGGTYQCDVTNGVYPDLSGEVTLDVGTVPVIKEQEGRHSIVSYDNVTIQCSVSGTEPITIKWYKNGRDISKMNIGNRNNSPPPSNVFVKWYSVERKVWEPSSGCLRIGCGAMAMMAAWFTLTRHERLSLTSETLLVNAENCVTIGDIVNLNVPEDLEMKLNCFMVPSAPKMGYLGTQKDWEDRPIVSVSGQQTPQLDKTAPITDTPVVVLKNFGLKYVNVTFGTKQTTSCTPGSTLSIRCSDESSHTCRRRGGYVTNRTSTKDSIESRLSIEEATILDSGRFECKAFNKFGSDGSRQTLIVHEPVTTTTISTTTVSTTTETTTKQSTTMQSTDEKISTTIYSINDKASKTTIHQGMMIRKPKLNESVNDQKEKKSDNTLDSSMITDYGDNNDTFPLEIASKSFSVVTKENISAGSDVEVKSVGVNNFHILNTENNTLHLRIDQNSMTTLQLLLCFAARLSNCDHFHGYLFYKKAKEKDSEYCVISSPVRTSYESCRQKLLPTDSDSRYGKLEPSKIWSANKQLETGYEIPDY
ncbi:Down syndrome cell adhesion molecule-like protein Dscam2 [Nymphon striatum]|nr:Down syndrome cell adhesion molecule-like protein Dscam2 [Nymphon striatum]